MARALREKKGSSSGGYGVTLPGRGIKKPKVGELSEWVTDR